MSFYNVEGRSIHISEFPDCCGFYIIHGFDHPHNAGPMKLTTDRFMEDLSSYLCSGFIIADREGGRLQEWIDKLSWNTVGMKLIRPRDFYYNPNSENRIGIWHLIKEKYL